MLKSNLVKIELIIFFMRLFSSIGFGMLYAGISVFLLNHLKMETNLALSIVGVFIALHYSLALLSGFFSGKWISPLGALAVSVLLQAVAIVVIYNSSTSFFIGAAIFLGGNMAGSTSINMIITQSFTTTNNIQERVFLRNHAGQNLGSMLGFIIAGYFQLWGNISNISYIASPLMLITFILCIIYQKDLADHKSSYSQLTLKNKRYNNFKFLIILLLSIFIILALLKFSQIMSSLLLIIILLALIALLLYNCKIDKFTPSQVGKDSLINTDIDAGYFIKKSYSLWNNRNNLIFIVLTICNLLFWSLYFLIPTGLMLFATYNTNNTIFGIQFPSAWLPNINSLLIIIGAPLLGIMLKHWDKHHKLSITHKFMIGLVAFSVAFIVLIIGILVNHYGKISIWWLILTYILITCSELFIVPSGLASIGKYVTPHKQHLMTGVWLATLGLGGIIASKLSSLVTITASHNNSSNTQFLFLFTSLAAITLIFALALYTLRHYKFDSA